MDRLRITQVNDVFYIDHFDGKAHVRGTLHLTLTHVFFIAISRKQEIWLRNQLIASVYRPPLTTEGAPLVIYGKNFRVIRLLIPRERDCHEVYTTIKQLSTVTHIDELPCFHRVPSLCHWGRSEGWTTCGLVTQFARFGLPNTSWNLTEVNNDFKICDTYPTVLCVPSTVTKSMMQASARFRSRRRFPVLTYLHPNGKSALCRSSQPLAGFSSRCVEDQMLLEAIRSANPTALPLYVVDTRPALNALTNRAQGKGYEDTTVYRNISIQFFDIENIHVVRGSLEKLLKVAQEPAMSLEAFTSGLEKSGWLRHLRVILEAAFFVALRLNDGSSVLVHCSDGWDRTAQVCSLAQIILDPYYRTCVGLEALIKKDWLSFGHKFSERCGLATSYDPREISPIFTQFLDCVRHLCEYCPMEFEYNCNLLCLLHDEAYAASYGTFVGCSDMERIKLKLSQTTFSVWPLVYSRRGEFLNPFYKYAELESRLPGPSFFANRDEPFDDGSVPNGIEVTTFDSTHVRHIVDMLPTFVLSPQLFHLWSGLFLRWEWRLPKSDRHTLCASCDLVRGTQTFLAHQRLLQARIKQLRELLGKSIDDVHLSQYGSEWESEGSDILTDQSVAEPFSAVPDLPTNANCFLNGAISVPGNYNTNTDIVDSTTTRITHLQPPSSNQLAAELNSVSVDWSHLSRRDESCANCRTLLALTDHTAHCHRCGLNVCSKCIVPGVHKLTGLWPSILPTAWLCERCVTRPSTALAVTDVRMTHEHPLTSPKAIQ